MENSKTFKNGQSKNWTYVKEYLEGLLQLSPDSHFSSILTKASFETLEFKLFDEICYFLMKLQDQEVDTVWPVLDKKHHIIFVKRLLESIENIKSTRNISFPNYQKSHFQDPRPENDKVLDFLIHLCDLAVDFNLENESKKESIGFSIGDDDTINNFIVFIAEKNAILTDHFSQLTSYKLKVREMSRILENHKDQLIQTGAVGTDEQNIDEDFVDNKKLELEEQLFANVVSMIEIQKNMLNMEV